MEEFFCDIKGYEGLYQVSNYGRVKSLRNGKELIRKPNVNKCGYLQVDLWRNGEGKLLYVHRLVAIAFIPNPLGLPMVNHKDEDKTNNRLENLEWCDCKYNINYGSRNERVIEKERNHPNKSKRLYQYTKSGVFVRSYPSVMEAARQTGIAATSISACCLNKPHYNSAGGYIWSFIPPKPTDYRALW